MPYTTKGEFSLNLNATLSIGPRIITTLFLTESTFMEINSQGTSGEAKLGEKKRSSSTGDQARRDPDSGECDSNRNVDQV